MAEALRFGFDREVSPALMQALKTEPFSELLDLRNTDTRVRDLQLRREPKGAVSWASLYVGLTTVLDLMVRNHRWRFRAARSHQERGAFDPTWLSWRSFKDVAADWPAVRQYVERVEPLVDPRWTRTEGVVHALLCSGASKGFTVANREASPWFSDQPTKDRIVGEITAPLVAAIDSHEGSEAWWPGRTHPLRLGTSPDVLGVNDAGQVLVIEAKPASATAGIVKGPVQVRVYAELFARWLGSDPSAVGSIRRMLDQRVELKLSRRSQMVPTPDAAVIPVLAIGGEVRSRVVKDRCLEVAEAIGNVPCDARLEPVQIWELDEHGDMAQQWTR